MEGGRGKGWMEMEDGKWEGSGKGMRSRGKVDGVERWEEMI